MATLGRQPTYTDIVRRLTEHPTYETFRERKTGDFVIQVKGIKPPFTMLISNETLLSAMPHGKYNQSHAKKFIDQMVRDELRDRGHL